MNERDELSPLDPESTPKRQREEHSLGDAGLGAVSGGAWDPKQYDNFLGYAKASFSCPKCGGDDIYPINELAQPYGPVFHCNVCDGEYVVLAATFYSSSTTK